MYLPKCKMKCKCYQGLLSTDTMASKQQSDQAISAMPNINWISFGSKSTCKCLGLVLHLRLQWNARRFVRWYNMLPIHIRKHSKSSWYMTLKIRKAKRNFKSLKLILKLCISLSTREANDTFIIKEQPSEAASKIFWGRSKSE